MIVRFKHKGLEKFFTSGVVRGIDARYAVRIKILLAALSTADSPENMNIIGVHLHPLKGKYKGFWSLHITKNWRLIFRFEDDNVTDVDLVDYH
jgi:toxin HigB-1